MTLSSRFFSKYFTFKRFNNKKIDLLDGAFCNRDITPVKYLIDKGENIFLPIKETQCGDGDSDDETGVSPRDDYARSPLLSALTSSREIFFMCPHYDVTPETLLCDSYNISSINVLDNC